MTQDEIIEIARRVGFPIRHPDWQKAVEEFAALVEEKATEKANARANASWELMCKKMVAFEREACAKIVEVEAMQYAEPVWAFEIVNDIRARGEQA